MTQIITIRDRTAADEALLLTLFAETKAPELALLGLAPAQLRPLLEMQYRGREMTYRTRYPDARDAVIECDAIPVGRVLLDRRHDDWRVIDIAVLCSCRGQGIASETMRTFQRECRELGIPLRLSVALGNPAQRLYERLGFVVQQPGPSGQPETGGAGFALDRAMEWNPTAGMASPTKARNIGSRQIA